MSLIYNIRCSRCLSAKMCVVATNSAKPTMRQCEGHWKLAEGQESQAKQQKWEPSSPSLHALGSSQIYGRERNVQFNGGSSIVGCQCNPHSYFRGRSGRVTHPALALSSNGVPWHTRCHLSGNGSVLKHQENQCAVCLAKIHTLFLLLTLHHTLIHIVMPRFVLT